MSSKRNLLNRYNRNLISAPNTKTTELLQVGLSFHRKGNLEDAEKIYYQILRINPSNFDALQLLASTLCERKLFLQALDYFKKAIAINPHHSITLFNQGNALQDLNRLEESLASYQRAIAINPNYIEAHVNQGNVFQKLNQFDNALESYERALAINPDYFIAHINQGNVFQKLNLPNKALASYECALAINPNYAEGYNNLGNAHKKLNDIEKALASYEHAIAIKPDYADAHYNRAIVLQETERFEEALESYEVAIKINSRHAPAFNNKGHILHKLGRNSQALESYNSAITINTNYVTAYYNRGILFKDLGKFDLALNDFERTISLEPDHAQANWNKSLLLITQGDYLNGWKLYEWRFKNPDTEKNYYSYQKISWRGNENLTGKKLFIYSEQGLGDSIQFCRYLPQVSAMGIDIIFETNKSLVPFISTINCKMKIIAKGDSIPDFDAYCPLMSLPYVFKSTLETVPAKVPYLSADKTKFIDWNKRLGEKQKPRVGICWSGSTGHSNDKNRSISLKSFLPILDLPFEWHSLQKEYRHQDEFILKEHPEIIQHQNKLNDFSDTASLIECLDLIISVDTSIAHVAGSLGKPVWILLPWIPDYRWLINRTDSPWYPTAKLFRQPESKNWDTTIQNIMEELNFFLK